MSRAIRPVGAVLVAVVLAVVVAGRGGVPDPGTGLDRAPGPAGVSVAARTDPRGAPPPVVVAVGLTGALVLAALVALGAVPVAGRRLRAVPGGTARGRGPPAVLAR